MKRLVPLIFVVMFVFPLIHLPSSQGSTLLMEKGVDLVEKTCKRTQNYDLCISSLRSDPRSSKTDVKGLARIMLELSQAKAESTLSYIYELNNKTTDPILKRYFDGCIEQYYDGAEKDLQNAIASLDSNNYKDASTNAVYVGRDALDCEDVFKGPPQPRKSPLTKQNNALYELSKVAGEIIYILE